MGLRPGFESSPLCRKIGTQGRRDNHLCDLSVIRWPRASDPAAFLVRSGLYTGQFKNVATDKDPEVAGLDAKIF